jgi:guanylate kinase
LARRAQRKLLKVVFGQSGLGKTSLLRMSRQRDSGYADANCRSHDAGMPDGMSIS